MDRGHCLRIIRCTHDDRAERPDGVTFDDLTSDVLLALAIETVVDGLLDDNAQLIDACQQFASTSDANARYRDRARRD